MNQPPPHGWQQQPPQQGWHQQPPPPRQGGYPPQGYPQPGYPPQPPRKKGKGAVIAVVVVVVVLLLGGLGTGAFFFINARKDRGYPQRNDALPELCGSVSAETLAKARTTNPDGSQSSQPDDKTTNCHWEQTEGRDNPGYRSLRLRVWQSEGMYQSGIDMVSTSGTAVKTVSDVSGIGDEAKAVTTEWPTEATSEYALVARKGDHTVVVEYVGADPGLFSLTEPDLNEFAEISKIVMNDVLGKL